MGEGYKPQPIMVPDGLCTVSPILQVTFAVQSLHPDTGQARGKVQSLRIYRALFMGALKIVNQSMDLDWSSIFLHAFLTTLAFRPATLKSTLWPLPVTIPCAPLI